MTNIISDGTEYRIVKEVTEGVIPAAPAWMIIPALSDSIAPNASVTESNTLDPALQVRDSVLTGIDVSGSIEVEFGRSPAMDLLFESATSSIWDVADTPELSLPVQTAPVYFSLMKRWPDPANPGQYIYQLHSGCMVNSITVTMSAGTEVTSSIAIVGTKIDADRNTVEPAGSTYPALTVFNVLRAPEVKDIYIDNEAGNLWSEVENVCITDMTLTMNRNTRGQPCLGYLGNKSTAIGKFSPTLDFTIFFTGNNLSEEFLKQNEVLISFTVGDASTDQYYAFSMTRGKFTAQSTPVGGTGTDVVNQMSYQGLLDSALVPPTSITVGTLLEGTTIPTFDSGSVENATPTEVAIVFSEDVAITDSTGVVILVAGAAATISSEVAATDTITFTLMVAVASGETVTFEVDNTNTITALGGGPNVRPITTPEIVANNV